MTKEELADEYSKNHRHLNTRQHFIDGWDKCLEVHHKTKTVDQRLLDRIEELENKIAEANFTEHCHNCECCGNCGGGANRVKECLK